MKEEKVFGFEIKFDEFIEEYNNRSEKDNTEVEIINLENGETKVLSEEEFNNYIKNNK